jgi:hypothetical protein
MKRFVLSVGTLLLLSTPSHAQRDASVGGELATGVRLGGSSGLTFKKYSRKGQSAFELIAGYNFDPKIANLGVTALFEKLPPLAGQRLNAQIGFGPTWVFRDTRIGVSGVLGFDWRLRYVPLALSVDWAPTFFFINRTGFSPVNGAFSARYVLNRGPKKP